MVQDVSRSARTCGDNLRGAVIGSFVSGSNKGERFHAPPHVSRIMRGNDRRIIVIIETGLASGFDGVAFSDWRSLWQGLGLHPCVLRRSIR